MCLGGAAASYLSFTEALSFFPPFLCPDSSGVSITLSHSDLVEIFGANKKYELPSDLKHLLGFCIS